MRLLIVDDEPALCRALHRQLESQFEVSVAPDVTAARAAIACTAFDVILCDFRLGGSSGLALYAILLAEHPADAAKVVFMTGGGLAEKDQRALESSGRPILDKPFRLEDFAVACARCSSERPPPPGEARPGARH
jgi:DNA-binding NtrC family response regulator